MTRPFLMLLSAAALSGGCGDDPAAGPADAPIADAPVADGPVADASPDAPPVPDAAIDAALDAPTDAPDPAVDWWHPLDDAHRGFDLATVSGGVLVVGKVITPVHAIWLAVYDTDGTQRWSVTDDATAGEDTAYDVELLPGGDFVVTATTDGTMALRRYTATGALVWSTPIPGAASLRGLGVDDAGNSYTGIVGATSREVGSFTAAGAPRWRQPVTSTGLYDVATRGGVVAAVGEDAPDARIDTFALDGAPGWQRELVTLGESLPEFDLEQVAVTSSGDVVALGPDHDTWPYYRMRTLAVAADNTAIRWEAEDELLNQPHLSITADDHTLFAYLDDLHHEAVVLERGHAGAIVGSARLPGQTPAAAPVADATSIYLLLTDLTSSAQSLQRRDR